jgi:hypothetical protein
LLLNGLVPFLSKGVILGAYIGDKPKEEKKYFKVVAFKSEGFMIKYNEIYSMGLEGRLYRKPYSI